MPQVIPVKVTQATPFVLPDSDPVPTVGRGRGAATTKRTNPTSTPAPPPTRTGVSCGRPMVARGAGYGVSPHPAWLRPFPGILTFSFTSFRRTMAMAFLVFAAVALLACSGEPSVQVEEEVTREVEATPTVEAAVTPSPVPTPTTAATATVAPEEEPLPPLEIPDRGYNSVGNPDAPVTLFDFSDFT